MFPLRFNPSLGLLVVGGTAAAVALGWSLAAYVWVAPVFATLLVLVAWRLALRLRHASDYAARLALAAQQVDSYDFKRPISDRAPQALDRLASALTEKNRQLVACAKENLQNELAVHAVFEGAPSLLLLVDGNGRVRLINEAVERAFQISQAEAVGNVFLQVVRDNEIDDALSRALESGEREECELDVMTARPAGRYKVRIQPFRSTKMRSIPPQAPRELPSTVEGAVVAMVDVTRLRHLERVRKEFVANVSHELRTPITAIKGFVETLADEDVPPATRTRFLSILKSEADRLDNLLTDLLDLSLLESDTRPLKREQINLKQFVSQVVMLLEPQAHRKGIRTVIQMAEDLPDVPAHPGMLEQALVNLVDNAIKYSQENGVVTIEGKRVGRDHVEVAVIDSGPGIPSEHLTRLFERFYRVDKARSRAVGGTGLGLAIVRHIVQRHGGTVRAESRLGKGSRFVVTLPIEAEEAPVPPWEE